MWFGLGVLRLSPETFWRLSLRELACLANAHGGDRIEPMMRGQFAALSARFPDS